MENKRHRSSVRSNHHQTRHFNFGRRRSKLRVGGSGYRGIRISFSFDCNLTPDQGWQCRDRKSRHPVHVQRSPSPARSPQHRRRHRSAPASPSGHPLNLPNYDRDPISGRYPDTGRFVNHGSESSFFDETSSVDLDKDNDHDDQQSDVSERSETNESTVAHVGKTTTTNNRIASSETKLSNRADDPTNIIRSSTRAMPASDTSSLNSATTQARMAVRARISSTELIRKSLAKKDNRSTSNPGNATDEDQPNLITSPTDHRKRHHNGSVKFMPLHSIVKRPALNDEGATAPHAWGVKLRPMERRMAPTAIRDYHYDWGVRLRPVANKPAPKTFGGHGYDWRANLRNREKAAESNHQQVERPRLSGEEDERERESNPDVPQKSSDETRRRASLRSAPRDILTATRYGTRLNSIRTGSDGRTTLARSSSSFAASDGYGTDGRSDPAVASSVGSKTKISNLSATQFHPPSDKGKSLAISVGQPRSTGTTRNAHHPGNTSAHLKKSVKPASYFGPDIKWQPLSPAKWTGRPRVPQGEQSVRPSQVDFPQAQTSKNESDWSVGRRRHQPVTVETREPAAVATDEPVAFGEPGRFDVIPPRNNSEPAVSPPSPSSIVVNHWDDAVENNDDDAVENNDDDAVENNDDDDRDSELHLKDMVKGVLHQITTLVGLGSPSSEDLAGSDGPPWPMPFLPDHELVGDDGAVEETADVDTVAVPRRSLRSVVDGMRKLFSFGMPGRRRSWERSFLAEEEKEAASSGQEDGQETDGESSSTASDDDVQWDVSDRDSDTLTSSSLDESKDPE